MTNLTDTEIQDLVVDAANTIAKGPQGPYGPQGVKGEFGPIGEKGDAGEVGVIGPKGERGSVTETIKLLKDAGGTKGQIYSLNMNHEEEKAHLYAQPQKLLPMIKELKTANATNDLSRPRIATDNSGNRYLTGEFLNQVTFGNKTLTAMVTDKPQKYITKTNIDANVTEFAKVLDIQTTSSLQQGMLVTANELEQVYLTTTFEGVATIDGLTVTAQATEKSTLVAKLDRKGKAEWVKKIKSSKDMSVTGIKTDSHDGSVCVCGSFNGQLTYPKDLVELTLNAESKRDSYLFKYKHDGVIEWGFHIKADKDQILLDGTVKHSSVHTEDLTIDECGCVCMTGRMSGRVKFGDKYLLSSGEHDCFVCRINCDGKIEWARRAGGSSKTRGRSIEIDSYGHVCVLGDFYGDAAFGEMVITSPASRSVFVSRMGCEGDYLKVTRAGGVWKDTGSKIVKSKNGDLLVSAVFNAKPEIGNLIPKSDVIPTEMIEMNLVGQSKRLGKIELTPRTNENSTYRNISSVDLDGNWNWTKATVGGAVDAGPDMFEFETKIHIADTFRGVMSYGTTAMPLTVATKNTLNNTYWAAFARDNDFKASALLETKNKGELVRVEHGTKIQVAGYIGLKEGKQYYLDKKNNNITDEKDIPNKRRGPKFCRCRFDNGRRKWPDRPERLPHRRKYMGRALSDTVLLFEP